MPLSDEDLDEVDLPPLGGRYQNHKLPNMDNHRHPDSSGHYSYPEGVRPEFIDQGPPRASQTRRNKNYPDGIRAESLEPQHPRTPVFPSRGIMEPINSARDFCDSSPALGDPRRLPPSPTRLTHVPQRPERRLPPLDSVGPTDEYSRRPKDYPYRLIGHRHRKSPTYSPNPQSSSSEQTIRPGHGPGYGRLKQRPESGRGEFGQRRSDLPQNELHGSPPRPNSRTEPSQLYKYYYGNKKIRLPRKG